MITLKRILTQKLALVAALLGFAVQASAQATLSIEDFSIAPGEQKDVTITLNASAADVSSIEGTLTLPAGLSLVKDAFGTNQHAAFSGFVAGNLNRQTGKFGAAAMGGIQTGTLTVKVMASTSLAATSAITLTGNITHSDKTSETVNTSATVTRTESGSPSDPGTGTGGSGSGTVTIGYSANNVTINAGETTSVDVELSNGPVLTGFEANVKASTGLSIVSITKSDRLASINYNATTGMVVSFGSISGTSGALFTVNLKADDDFAGVATVTVSGFVANDGSAKAYEPADITFNANVLDNSGVGAGNVTLTFADSEVNLPAGQSATVAVSLNSEVDLMGFEAQLLLPAGVTAKVDAGSLLGTSVNYNASTGIIVYYGSISAKEGELLKLTLTADDSFAAEGTVQLNNIAVTTSSAKSVEPAATSLTVKPKDAAAKAAADALVNDLQQKLDAAKEAINTNDPDVAADYAQQVADIQAEIDALKAEVEQKYDANTLAVADVQAKHDQIAQEIEQLKAAADAAESAYQEEQARAAANEDAYQRLSSEIAAVQKQLDDATKDIQSNYPNAAAQMSGDIQDIQNQINALQADVDAQHNAGTLTASSTVNTKPVADAISALKASAAAKEQEIAEKQVANDQAYTRLNEAIDAVQEELNNAETKIRSDYPDAVQNVIYKEQAIQSSIDDLRRQLYNDYVNLALDNNSTVDTSDISAAIKELLEDAAAADAANKAAAKNQAVYDELSKKIPDLQQNLNNAKHNINTNDPDVAANYKDQIEALQKRIDDLKTKLQQDYAAGKLATDNSCAEEAQKIWDDTDAMSLAAGKAENAFKANTALNKELDEVQAQLDEVKDALKGEYANYAEKFNAQVDALQKRIDDARAEVKKKYEAGELTLEDTTDAAAISRAVSDLLESIKAEAAGIFAAVKNIEGAVAYYDVNGRRISAPQKGKVTIVKMADGKTKKIILK